MDTFGVSFEHFDPDCGYEKYCDIRDRLIGDCRTEMDRYVKELPIAEKELAAINSFKANVETTQKALAEMSKAFPLKPDGLDMTTGELLATGGDHENDVSSREKSECVGKWICESQESVRKAAELCERSGMLAACKVDILRERIDGWGKAIDFWESYLEVQRGNFVFFNADNKYKPKVCREMCKLVVAFAAKCDTFRTTCERESRERGETSVDYGGLVEYVFEENARMIKFYRRMKTEIAEFGVEEAMKDVIMHVDHHEPEKDA